MPGAHSHCPGVCTVHNAFGPEVYTMPSGVYTLGSRAPSPAYIDRAQTLVLILGMGCQSMRCKMVDSKISTLLSANY